MKKSLLDSLLEFIADPDGLTEEDLIAELENAEIDVDEARRRVSELVKRLIERR